MVHPWTCAAQFRVSGIQLPQVAVSVENPPHAKQGTRVSLEKCCEVSWSFPRFSRISSMAVQRSHRGLTSQKRRKTCVQRKEGIEESDF